MIVQYIPPWRQWVRKRRFVLNVLVSAVNAATITYTYANGWLLGVPLSMLCLAGWVMMLREIVLVARLQAVRQVTAERDVRPRRGRLARSNGELHEILFVETGEQGVFMAVTVDGEPVVVGRADRFSVDVIGPGQQVVWSYDDHGTGNTGKDR